MNARFRARFAVAILGVMTAWLATWSWRDLVEEPGRFIGPALVAAVLIALVGSGVRALTASWALALVAQLVTATVYLHWRHGTGTVLGGWVPTPDGLAGLVDQIRAGAGQLNKYSAPVSDVQAEAPIYLLAVAVLLIVSVDLIAGGLRQAPWAGLPLVVALTVPISILDQGLAAPVFLATGVLYAVLLSAAENDQLLAWGQTVTARPHRDDGSEHTLEWTSLAGPALKIAALTAAGALLLPVLLPLGDGIFSQDEDSGEGTGPGNQVTLMNPLVDLRRDLVRNDGIPLLNVTTNSADTSYLRVSVLDAFTGSAWEPGRRQLAAANRAEGPLPDPPGVLTAAPGDPSLWNLATTSSFRTTWLPTPYITREISISEGDWRYDEETLDIASADGEEVPSTDVSYALEAFTPRFDRNRLDGAAPPRLDLREAMTEVPDLLPEVTAIAEDVTASGETDYAKAVLLQDWFRASGGFTYSLDQRRGAGMEQLLRFITTDKVGYCEQFSAAMAVMARAVGIPARVVVGFLTPEKIGPSRYQYTSDDLHAWPEIYFAGSGWVRFEPTPSARTGLAPRWTTGELVETPTPTPTAGPTQNVVPTPLPEQGTVDPATATPNDGSTSTPLVALIGLALLLILASLPSLLRRSLRRRRLLEDVDARREVLALWEELQATAIDHRVPWPHERSVRTVAGTLTARAGASIDQLAELDRLASLVERALYSRRFTLSEAARTQAREAVAVWSELLAASVPPTHARLARVIPRSVFVQPRKETVSDDASPVLSETR